MGLKCAKQGIIIILVIGRILHRKGVLIWENTSKIKQDINAWKNKCRTGIQKVTYSKTMTL